MGVTHAPTQGMNVNAFPLVVHILVASAGVGVFVTASETSGGL